MEEEWEQFAENRPGLFPVLLYRNENDKAQPKANGCQCGYECTSGACCCYLGASELSCNPPGKASCEAKSETETVEQYESRQEPSKSLLTLAIAASTVPDSKESNPEPVKTPGKKTCRRCKVLFPRSAFCANLRAPDGLYTQCRSCVSQKDQERRLRVKKQKKAPAASKVCSRCQTAKVRDEFYLDASRPDGLQTYCKPCFSLTYKEKRRQRKA